MSDRGQLMDALDEAIWRLLEDGVGEETIAVWVEDAIEGFEPA
jgi:hypothetical protein